MSAREAQGGGQHVMDDSDGSVSPLDIGFDRPGRRWLYSFAAYHGACRFSNPAYERTTSRALVGAFPNLLMTRLIRSRP
jgi:hypothetical protein